MDHSAPIWATIFPYEYLRKTKWLNTNPEASNGWIRKASPGRELDFVACYSISTHFQHGQECITRMLETLSYDCRCSVLLQDKVP